MDGALGIDKILQHNQDGRFGLAKAILFARRFRPKSSSHWEVGSCFLVLVGDVSMGSMGFLCCSFFSRTLGCFLGFSMFFVFFSR